jgi:RNA polymerase sigma-B factor
MHVHIVARTRSGANPVPHSGIGALSEALQSVGCRTHLSVADQAGAQDLPAAERTAAELGARWRVHRPDVIHTFGVVAALAALQARPAGVPLVVTFDEHGADAALEERIARQADAVLPASTAELARWRRAAVPTLTYGGAPSLPLVVPCDDPAPTGGDEILTTSAGAVLDHLVEALPGLPVARLVVLARPGQWRMAQVQRLAARLGVLHRLEWRGPGHDWSETGAGAALLVAGEDTARHGFDVLAAALRGVPAVAFSTGAHRDHIVAGVTGELVRPDAGAAALVLAVRALLGDPLRRRSYGESAAVRARALQLPKSAGERLLGLYRRLVSPPAIAAARPLRQLPADRHELVEQYLPLARQLARRYAGRGQSLDDLVQVASMGLVAAASRFDPAHGKEFHSYAVPTILGELRKHFRDHAWAVRVPRGLQETSLRVQRTAEELQASLGHGVSAAEVAAELGLLEEEVIAAQQAQAEARSSKSLDLPVGERGGEQVADLVGEPDLALDLVEESTDVRAALAKLPPRELEIVLLRFFGDLTQGQIAERLGISQVHVSRVLSRTLAAVRDHVLHDVPLPAAWERDRAAAAAGAVQPAGAPGAGPAGMTGRAAGTSRVPLPAQRRGGGHHLANAG